MSKSLFNFCYCCCCCEPFIVLLIPRFYLLCQRSKIRTRLISIGFDRLAHVLDELSESCWIIFGKTIRNQRVYWTFRIEKAAAATKAAKNPAFSLINRVWPTTLLFILFWSLLLPLVHHRLFIFCCCLFKQKQNSFDHKYTNLHFETCYHSILLKIGLAISKQQQ